LSSSNAFNPKEKEMAADETTNTVADDAGDPSRVEVSPAEPEPQPPDESTPTPKPGWSRRAFFQAAALGAAAAAFLEGKRFVPSIAWANDLSGLPCTANDVTVGVGTVLNEPCDCNGTLGAPVAFQVTNNTGSNRYCVVLHLPDGTDIPLSPSILPPNQTTVMTGTLPVGLLSCRGSGQSCFGGSNPTVEIRGKCGPGLCATVAWNTSSGSVCPNLSPPGGQCRHQAICIQHFGVALACTGANCPPPCGGTATLTATVTPPNGGATSYDYTLKKGGVLVQTDGGIVSTAHAFTGVQVTGSPDLFSVEVKANGGGLNGCTRLSNEVSLTASGLAKPGFSVTAGPNACTGATTFTATPGNLDSYTWYDNNSPIPNGTTNPLTVNLAPGDHSIKVKGAKGGCNATSDAQNVTVPAAVTVVGPTGKPGCTDPDTNTAPVQLSASASGGLSGGTYTFEWFKGTTSLGTGNPLTVQLGPGNHTDITVVATKGGCNSAPAAVSVDPVNDAVTTTLDCGTTPDCHGNLSFKATGHGGQGPYTFAWTVGGNAVQGNTSDTLAYTPNVDCSPHTVSVKAKDSNNCVSKNPDTRTVTQTVATAVSGCP
jgi:hypothetical protein